ncbi:MAG: hypothetical protein JW893_06425 [Candidatus Omnitrophica bacterium]|nr:hypothetical protein [Candidatus Omnitrophota bacterium]
MSYRILFVLSVVFLTGCSAQSQSFQKGNTSLTDENIELVQAGMRSEEVLSVLGEADEIIPQKDGTEVWIYRSAESQKNRATDFSKKTTRVRAKRLEVEVNADGIVTNVVYDESDETKKSVF